MLATLWRFATRRYTEPILIGLVSVALGAGGMAVWHSSVSTVYEARTAYVDALLRDYGEQYKGLEDFRTPELDQHVREVLIAELGREAFESGQSYGRTLWHVCASRLTTKHRARCSPECEEIDFVLLLAKVSEVCGGSSVYKGATERVRKLWDEPPDW